MDLKRSGLLLAFILSLSHLNACTHAPDKATEESLEIASELPSTDGGEEVNFDGNAQAPSDEASDPPPEPSEEETKSPDFNDPSEVGLSPDMLEKTGSDGADLGSASMESPLADETTASPSFADEATPEDLPALDNTLLNVSFAKNSSRVGKKFRMPLKDIAARLKADRQLRVHLAGHADARGSSHYNKKLSLKRAKAVKQALLKLGVKSKQIKIEAFGKGRLLVVGESESEHAQNRRVEVSLK